MTANLPAGTVTFLFTDIEGSASLWEREPNAMRAALARHDAIFETVVAEHAGVLYKHIGDAVQAAFPLPASAVLAALAAQRALAAEAWPTSNPIRVRMGLHTGPATPAETDYTTTHTLNRVARIMGAAHGGQVLLSAETARLVQADLRREVTLRDLAEHRMKGLAQLEHLYQLTVPDLPAEFPPLPTQLTIPDNLPTPVTSFVGRAKEIAEVKRLLAGTHLLTLTGSGGTGKTRLSLQAATEVRPDFRDGVWLIELAPLTDPDQVLSTIAAVFGVREQPGRPLLDALKDYLRAKRLLLILDNCEHLVAACAATADQLLRACPQVTLLASSREGLGIAGETTFHVPSLSLPDPQPRPRPEALGQYEAVRLFVERAQAVRPGFALTEANAPAVAQICRRLDGIPLALELAAARLKLLSVEQLAARLDDRFRLLTGGSRTALPRQQTLRALIDWSYDLLSEPERAALQQFSIFAGGWTLAAAEVVVALDEADGLEVLGQLVNKSLVAAETEADGEPRYRLLETVRQYAREKLLEAGRGAAVRGRHLAYYLAYAEAGEPHMTGPGMIAWLDMCEVEHDNFRAALDWGLEADADAALRLAGALHWFWGRRCYFTEGRAYLAAALERVAALPAAEGEAARRRQRAQAQALFAVSELVIGLGDYQRSLTAAEESLRLYRLLADRVHEGWALAQLGFAACQKGALDLAEQALLEAIRLGRATGHAPTLSYALGVYGRYFLIPRGDITGAQAAYQDVLQIARRIGNRWIEGQVELGLGLIARQQQDWEALRVHLAAAAQIYGEIRDRQLEQVARSGLAEAERYEGRLSEAEALYVECLAYWQELGQGAASARVLECLAFIARTRRQFERAARLFGAAEAWREALREPMTPYERPEYETEAAALRAEMDPAQCAAAWAAGRALALDEAVAYALNFPNPEAVA